MTMILRWRVILFRSLPADKLPVIAGLMEGVRQSVGGQYRLSGASSRRWFGRPARRLLCVLLAAFIGMLVSWVIGEAGGIHAHQIEASAFYGKSVAGLLAIGLYVSVYGISREELRKNAIVVLVAVTVGVTAKAFLGGAVMVIAYGGAGYLLLGVAVAQIDPLSVAASLRDRRMSDRAKSVLSAWAAFDDPITVLLVVYLAAVSLPTAGLRGSGVLAGDGGYLWQLGYNGLLIAAGGMAWYLLGVWRGAHGRRCARALQYLVLAGLIAVAAAFGLYAGIAVCGLFFRPEIDSVVGWIVNVAFYAAAFLLGMLLSTGVLVGAGVLLGVSVFLAQVLAGLVISRGMPLDDRVRLALGQQNGVTAIILALAIQPYFPVAVGVVAVAILTVNILHILSNACWDSIGSVRLGSVANSRTLPASSDLSGTRVSREDYPGIAESGSVPVVSDPRRS